MHLLSALLIAFQAATAPDTAHIVIVATTDVHGRVFRWDYVRDDAARRGALEEGFPGFTTRGVTVWDRARLGGRGRVRRIAEAARAAMAALERFGADLKTVLIHSGFGKSSYAPTGVGPENDAAALAA